MADALSPQWFAELAHKLEAVVLGEAGHRPLLLGVRVTDAPEGPLEYTITIGADAPCALDTSGATRPEVVLVESYAAALRLADGASITAELGDGSVKVEGDIARLLAAQEELAALAEALSGP